MATTNKVNLSLLTSQNLSDLIVRKYDDNYIIGVVVNSSGFLHKRKRFRPGGLFCEEIFGILYKCFNNHCKTVIEFNKNPILNRICPGCNRFMKFNFKRKYRFASLFFNFPVLNYFYFINFINSFKLFKIFRKTYLNKEHLSKFSHINSSSNSFVNAIILENKFLNFVNLLHKIINDLELFKNKLNFLQKKKSTTEVKFDKFNKILNDLEFLNKIFLTIFPVLPAGLRVFSFNNNKFINNARLNYLYKNIIDVNNIIFDDSMCSYNLKPILLLHFLVESVLNFYKQRDTLNQNNDLYSKLYGKYGVFRQNLLGFRVDYSGRATIVPDPFLPLNLIGLPFNMIKHKDFIKEEEEEETEDESEEEEEEEDDDDNLYESSFYSVDNLDKMEFSSYFLPDYSFIANRAPTLHKMNVQAFSPVLVEGESVQFNPLLCVGYNADFDGDQMGIFEVLQQSSISESLHMLSPLVNLYSPTTKSSIFNLTQGMSSGFYFLSNYNYLKFIDGYIFDSYIDVLEHINRTVLIDSPILLRSFNFFYFSTCGRLLFNYNLTKK